jgi:hypothetical protein
VRREVLSRLLSKNVEIRIHKTIILSVVLYVYKTWSLTLRDGHRVRVFENRVLRRIFGSKRDEVTCGWRKLLNEELRDMYSSPSISRMIKYRRMRREVQRGSWKDRMGWCGLDWLGSGYGQLEISSECCNEILSSIKF